MSKASPAKTGSEMWQFIWREYQRKHPGPFRPNDVVDWAVSGGMADLPKIDPRRILVRDFKSATRDIKIKDAQDRLVREMLPAKVPVFDASGQMYLDLQYDHIHTMSVDHALLAFDQRDDNIRKQKKSANRDLLSFLDNNPNAAGHQQKFVFDFCDDDDQSPPAAGKVEETPTPPNKPR